MARTSSELRQELNLVDSAGASASLDTYVDAVDARGPGVLARLAEQRARLRAFRSDMRRRLQEWNKSMPIPQAQKASEQPVAPTFGQQAFNKLHSINERRLELEHELRGRHAEIDVLLTHSRERIDQLFDGTLSETQRISLQDRFAGALSEERLVDFEYDLAFLEQLSEFIRTRQDCLCMGRTPTLADIVLMPAAHFWVCNEDDARVVPLLAALATTSDDPLDYLKERENLAPAQSALKCVHDAANQRGYRWWGLLHRDMCDVLRGKLSQIPIDGQLSAPSIALHQDLAKGLRWLQMVHQKIDAGEVPMDFQEALISKNLIASY